MNALSNANMEVPSPRTGFASCAIPEAKSSQTGVSVEYTPDSAKKWYVFRITYGREQLAADYLIEHGTYAYLAMGWKQELRNGKKHRVLKPLFNLVFAYVTPDEAYTLVRDTPLCSFITFYYDHFTVALDYRNPPLTIPSVEMQSFIRATCLQDPHVMVVDPSLCNFLSDEEVLVVRIKTVLFKLVHFETFFLLLWDSLSVETNFTFCSDGQLIVFAANETMRSVIRNTSSISFWSSVRKPMSFSLDILSRVTPA